MAIVFDTQEDFENAVMKVLVDRLEITVTTQGHESVQWVKVYLRDSATCKTVSVDRDGV